MQHAGELRRSLGPVDPPETITCVECEGVAHLVSHPPPDQGFEQGQSVVYLCASCGLRLDVVLDTDEGDGDDSSPAWRHPIG